MKMKNTASSLYKSGLLTLLLGVFSGTAHAQCSVVTSPSSLAFTYQIGGSQPASQQISVTDVIPSFLIAFSPTTSSSWLSAVSSNPTTPAVVTVSLNTQ